jgi:hypothetical protein
MVVSGAGKGRDLSGFEAARSSSAVPGPMRLEPKSGYGMVGTKEFVICRDNRRDRFRRELKVRRALASDCAACDSGAPLRSASLACAGRDSAARAALAGHPLPEVRSPVRIPGGGAPKFCSTRTAPLS